METKEWQRSVNGQVFVISTARDLPHDFVQEAFANPAMYWAQPMSAANMETMMANSCTLGMYRAEDGKRTPIGMARMITDYVTLAYLTDVYLADEYRGFGLGKWMVHCCREFAMAVPELRFMVLLTGSEQARRMYRRELGMGVMGSEETLVAMGARKSKLCEAAAASPAQDASDA